MASRPPERGPNDPAPDPARARFFMLNAVRLSGVAMVVMGVLILRGVIAIDPIAGWALLAVGLIDVFVIPQLLARKWRSPPA